MILSYFALGILLIVIVVIFYGFIYLHELPYETAKHRNHPQKEAIYVACWLSLFTLHAIWPIVFIWALSKPRPLSVTVTGQGPNESASEDRLRELEKRLRVLEDRNAQTPNSTVAS